MALLEARLTEEKDWRKQLEIDLSAAQAALKKDKEVKKLHLCGTLCERKGNNITAKHVCEICLTLMQRIIVVLKNYKIVK